MIGLPLCLAALAALCNAAGDLLQRTSAASKHSSPRHSLKLLVELLAEKRWLGGVVLSLAGLGVHVGALSVGELSVVQPVLVAELPLAVVGATYRSRRRLGRRDALAVLALAVGLALFVAFLDPRGGRPLEVSGTAWAVGLGTALVVASLLVVGGWRARGDLRAGLLSAAAGLGYGLTGVFFTVVGRTGTVHGLGAVLISWQTYAALAVGSGSFYLLQNALAAGKLVAVEPGLTLVNPVVAVVWGLLVFGETVRTGGAIVGSIVGAALLAGGVLVLTRSPVFDNRPEDDVSPTDETATAPDTAAAAVAAENESAA